MKAFVAKLLRSHAAVFDKLSDLQQLEVDTTLRDHHVPGHVPPAVLACKLCGRKKHAVRWVYRLSQKNRRFTTGSTCFACWKATSRLLKCSRSPRLLVKAGALDLVKEVSQRVQEELSAEDVCNCDQCHASN